MFVQQLTSFIAKSEVRKTFVLQRPTNFLKVTQPIQQAPPNFLRAAALGEYKKPVVVMPGSEEANEEEEVEPQPERESRESLQIPQVLQSASKEMDHVFPSLYPHV